MIIGAAVANGSSSTPLFVIGGAWLVIGVASFVQGRRVARRIDVEGDEITFYAPVRKTTVSASEILEITRPRRDSNHWLWLNVRTAHNGTIKIASRQSELAELLVYLKHRNPDLEITRI